MKEPITFEFNEKPSLRKGKSVTYTTQMNAVCPIVVSSKHFTLLSFFFPPVVSLSVSVSRYFSCFICHFFSFSLSFIHSLILPSLILFSIPLNNLLNNPSDIGATYDCIFKWRWSLYLISAEVHVDVVTFSLLLESLGSSLILKYRSIFSLDEYFPQDYQFIFKLLGKWITKSVDCYAQNIFIFKLTLDFSKTQCSSHNSLLSWSNFAGFISYISVLKRKKARLHACVCVYVCPMASDSSFQE